MALLPPPAQSPRKTRHHLPVCFFVLCAAHLCGQGTTAAEDDRSGSHREEIVDENAGGLSPGSVPAWRIVAAGSAAPAAPGIVVHPVDRVVAEGMRTTFSVGLDLPDSTVLFQWRRDGLAIPGANDASYTIPAVEMADAGRYACDVLNAAGAVSSEFARLTVIPAARAGRLVNFSVVTSLDAPGATTTVDYAVGGAGTSGAKSILVRGVGPSLARFATPQLNPAPSIELFSGATKIDENVRWGGRASVVEAAARVGAFPLLANDSADAAILDNAVAGDRRTIRFSGYKGATGVVLGEIYDATPVATFTTQTPRLMHCSVLKNIAAGASLSVGFVISGQTAKTVLIRVVGPSLAAWHLAGVMPNPELTLFRDVTPIAVNDNWAGSPELRDAAASVGALPLDPASNDAALVVSLASGSYAVEASDANNRGGIALVEIYEIP